MLHPKLANKNVKLQINPVPGLSIRELSSNTTLQSTIMKNIGQNPGATSDTTAEIDTTYAVKVNNKNRKKHANTNRHTSIWPSSLDSDNVTDDTRISVPKETEETKTQLRKARKFFRKNHQEHDFEDEKSDVCMNFGHSDDIFKHLRSIERLLKPDPLYMDKQSEITWKDRFIVIDWIMEVHQNFKFSPETLFLAVNLLDRFLASKEIRKENLQLASITALLIASKYEENLNERTLDEFLDMTKDAYTRENFIKAEKYMLATLEYNLGWPGPLSFLRRINKADDYDNEIRNMAKYFLEVATLDEQFVDCIPSFLSAGAYYLARDILKKGEWVCLRTINTF